MAFEIHISVVSHGHGQHIDSLLSDLAALPSADSLQLTLTLNIPEQLSFELAKLPFPHVLQENATPFSFSKNHNLAFDLAPEPESARFFLVLNPDTRIEGSVLSDLANVLNSFESQNVGVVGPKVVDEHGKVQENGRVFPDWAYLLKKLFGHEPANPIHSVNNIASVDWLAGMCVLLRRDTFRQLGGFDEAYRLYYEDVDLCLRLRQFGKTAILATDYQIVHIGQWKSRRNITHLFWHCRSALRFLGKLRAFRSKTTSSSNNTAAPTPNEE